jgi:hypothetical protein
MQFGNGLARILRSSEKLRRNARFGEKMRPKTAETRASASLGQVG